MPPCPVASENGTGVAPEDGTGVPFCDYIKHIILQNINQLIVQHSPRKKRGQKTVAKMPFNLTLKT